MPLGGSNLPTNYLETRYDHFDSHGIPARPDWGRLHALRQRQMEEKQSKGDEHKHGAHKALLLSLQPDTAANKRLSKAEEELRQLREATEGDDEKDASLGFLQEFLPQTKDDEDDSGDEDRNGISLDLGDIKKLDKDPESYWHCMAPKRRRLLIEEAEDQDTANPVPSKLQRLEQQSVS